jgi:outer membrane protein assembly factor BamB
MAPITTQSVMSSLRLSNLQSNDRQQSSPGRCCSCRQDAGAPVNALLRSGVICLTKPARAKEYLTMNFRMAPDLMWPASVVTALLAASTLLSLADQPQWGELHSRNGVSSATRLPETWDTRTGKNIRWVAELGTSTYSTPVIARGRVFIGTNNGKPRTRRHTGDRGVLMCLDDADGRLHWQLLVPKLPHDPYLDCPGVGITSTALVADDRVYLVSNRGEVLSLDLDGHTNGNSGPFRDEARFMAPLGLEPLPVSEIDADIIWCFDMPKETGAHPHDASNMSVLLHGDFLYSSTSNGVDYTHRHRPAPHAPGLIVLDRETGRWLARDATGIGARIFHSTFSSPSLGIVDGQALVFYGGGDGIVYAFEALTKAPPAGQIVDLREKWRFDCDPSAPKQNISQYQGNRRVSPSSIIGSPVFHRDRIYVTVGGDPWHGKREAWLKCIDATKSGDITSTGELWSYALQRHSTSTPAIHDGLVYVTDHGRLVHCLDADSGRLYWTHETNGEIWGSPLVADGKVFVGTRRGELCVLAAGRERRVLHSADFGEPINGTPVAANHTLYVATMSRLFAIALETPKSEVRSPKPEVRSPKSEVR